MSKGALSRFPRLTLAGALTNAVLRRSDRCLKHYYSVRPGAGCDSFVRCTRGGQTAASYAVGFEKNCLDNDTRLYLMSVPTEKIVQCIEFKNVSRGSSLHLESEARSGRYSCLCVVESN